MKKEIIVTVDLEGKVEVSAEGYKGKGCTEATKFIEDALGISDGKRTKKPEWYAHETVKQQQRT